MPFCPLCWNQCCQLCQMHWIWQHCVLPNGKYFLTSQCGNFRNLLSCSQKFRENNPFTYKHWRVDLTKKIWMRVNFSIFHTVHLPSFFRDIVELLLSYEASCNSADDKGSSPLHLAAWAGHAPIVDILLTRGPSIANVNLTVNELSLFGWPLEDDLFSVKRSWS